MKTTIDLPDGLLHRAKVIAAQRRVTLKQLVVAGLELVTESPTDIPDRGAALARLQQGFHLGGKPLSRAEAHERH